MKDWFCSEQLVLYSLETCASYASKLMLGCYRSVYRSLVNRQRPRTLLVITVDLCLIAESTTHQLMPRLDLPNADA